MVKKLLLSTVIIIFTFFQARTQCVESLSSYPIGATSLELNPIMSAQNIMAITAYLNGVNPVVSTMDDMNSTIFTVTNPLTYEQVIGAISTACPDQECIYSADYFSETEMTVFPELPLAVFNQLLLVAPYDDNLPSASGFVSYVQYSNTITPEQMAQIEAIICPAPIPTLGQWSLIVLFLFLCIFGLLSIQKSYKTILQSN
ncbi:MAG: hypothetical protein IPL23_03410 [Saprospiraceae bacterium]|nr:hypothetical protein [Saprospiraceae bacterium]MBK8632396.1 hypothetical protein [Saprospiraceae bacterium]MBP7643038.1 hypothetical protein [Saprospiraceae bacterium]